MKSIAIFASGSGSNAEAIMKYFQSSEKVKIISVFSNKSDAKVIERATKFEIDTFIFSKKELESGVVLEKLSELNPDLIVLAGFLLKIPDEMVKTFPNKIINIHPALLPKYGGKGMYGINVHKAVLENREKETGITIHYVNEQYDEGNIIFQESINITDCQSPEEVALKVLSLEHRNYPVVIDEVLRRKH